MVDDGYTQKGRGHGEVAQGRIPSLTYLGSKAGEAQKVEASKAYVNLLNAARVITIRGEDRI